MNERARDYGERKLTMILKRDVGDLYNSKSHIVLKAPLHTPFYARVHGDSIVFHFEVIGSKPETTRACEIRDRSSPNLFMYELAFPYQSQHLLYYVAE